MVAEGLKDDLGGAGSRCAHSQAVWTSEIAPGLAAGAGGAVGAGLCTVHHAVPRGRSTLGAAWLFVSAMCCCCRAGRVGPLIF